MIKHLPLKYLCSMLPSTVNCTDDTGEREPTELKEEKPAPLTGRTPHEPHQLQPSPSWLLPSSHLPVLSAASPSAATAPIVVEALVLPSFFPPFTRQAWKKTVETREGSFGLLPTTSSLLMYQRPQPSHEAVMAAALHQVRRWGSSFPATRALIGCWAAEAPTWGKGARGGEGSAEGAARLRGAQNGGGEEACGGCPVPEGQVSLWLLDFGCYPYVFCSR